MRRCLLLATAAGGAVALLVAMRPDQLAELRTWSGADALTVAAWTTATATSAWLAAVAALAAIAARMQRPRVARIAIRLTPRALRPVVEAALAASMVLTSVASAHALPAPVAVDQPVVRTKPAAPAAPASPPPTAPAPAPPAAKERTHRVRPGDNLWLIAREELRSRGGVRLDGTAVARYWLAVIAANRATLRSGNPNLIFPGELVALPEPG